MTGQIMLRRRTECRQTRITKWLAPSPVLHSSKAGQQINIKEELAYLLKCELPPGGKAAVEI